MRSDQDPTDLRANNWKAQLPSERRLLQALPMFRPEKLHHDDKLIHEPALGMPDLQSVLLRLPNRLHIDLNPEPVHRLRQSGRTGALQGRNVRSDWQGRGRNRRQGEEAEKPWAQGHRRPEDHRQVQAWQGEVSRKVVPGARIRAAEEEKESGVTASRRPDCVPVVRRRLILQ